jgi:hypothetical protein
MIMGMTMVMVVKVIRMVVGMTHKRSIGLIAYFRVKPNG